MAAGRGALEPFIDAPLHAPAVDGHGRRARRRIFRTSRKEPCSLRLCFAVGYISGASGPSLAALDCGSGITQVWSGMTTPAGTNVMASPEQSLVATNFAYNIARGAAVLAGKWNDAPAGLPIAGTDTNALPSIVENW